MSFPNIPLGRCSVWSRAMLLIHAKTRTSCSSVSVCSCICIYLYSSITRAFTPAMTDPCSWQCIESSLEKGPWQTQLLNSLRHPTHICHPTPHSAWRRCLQSASWLGKSCLTWSLRPEMQAARATVSHGHPVRPWEYFIPGEKGVRMYAFPSTQKRTGETPYCLRLPRAVLHPQVS